MAVGVGSLGQSEAQVRYLVSDRAVERQLRSVVAAIQDVKAAIDTIRERFIAVSDLSVPPLTGFVNVAIAPVS